MNKGKLEEITVVAVIALPEEYEIFCEIFPFKRDLPCAGDLIRVEHNTQNENLRLISVLCKDMGSENALTAVMHATSDLTPSLVASIGIAGSLSNDASLGHVCVSSEIIDILQNAKVSDKTSGSTPKKSGKQQLTSHAEYKLCPKNYSVETRFQADFRWLKSHPKRKVQLDAWKSDCEHRITMAFEGQEAQIPPSEKLELHVGPIVCGPVTASKQFKTQVQELNRKALAIETESGGIFRACSEQGLACITLRGICDPADNTKNELEEQSKNAWRKIAMQNACCLFETQIRTQSFLDLLVSPGEVGTAATENGAEYSPTQILSDCEGALEAHLEASTPDYKNRNGKVRLPLPRIRRLPSEEEHEALDEQEPTEILDALKKEKVLFLKLPKSYPDNTLPWTIGLSLLKSDLDGKQPLPITFSGESIGPPKGTIQKAVDYDISNSENEEHFSKVFIVNEPNFRSKTRLAFLVSELKKFEESYIVVVSKAETPVAPIDGFKADISSSDYVTTSVPFRDIAIYLEEALELEPGEADAAATRLDDTFSKFRLNTHPAYFIGIQENTISALINANQRVELIQLAVDGLLSFVVASDLSAVPLGRTTREEYLSNLAFKIKVERTKFSQADLIADAQDFAEERALEIDAVEFTQGFFKYGILTNVTGEVSFSLAFLESYLLSQRLLNNPIESLRYFKPEEEEFDYFTFDLYAEEGADKTVVDAIGAFVDSSIKQCEHDLNVFEAREVKPRALGHTKAFLAQAKQMSDAVETITHKATSSSVRTEKQRLIDAKAAVASKVGMRKKQRRESLSPDIQKQFERLDNLSRSQILLATLIGSGAERLNKSSKQKIARDLLKVSERFVHYWTLDRKRIDFDEMRNDLLSEESIETLVSQFDLFEDTHDDVRMALEMFIDDQEMKALSGPLSAVLNRVANYAGVRSLKPIVQSTKPQNATEALIRGAWFMDVESMEGKAVLKDALQAYKGSELFRLVMSNHLIWRLFWHHWEAVTRSNFSDVAGYSIKPMGLINKKK